MFNMIMFTVAGAEDARRGEGGQPDDKKGQHQEMEEEKKL